MYHNKKKKVPGPGQSHYYASYIGEDVERTHLLDTLHWALGSLAVEYCIWKIAAEGEHEYLLIVRNPSVDLPYEGQSQPRAHPVDSARPADDHTSGAIRGPAGGPSTS